MISPNLFRSLPFSLEKDKCFSRVNHTIAQAWSAVSIIQHRPHSETSETRPIRSTVNDLFVESYRGLRREMSKEKCERTEKCCLCCWTCATGIQSVSTKCKYPTLLAETIYTNFTLQCLVVKDNVTFFSLFQSHIRSQRCLFSIKIKEIFKKWK